MGDTWTVSNASVASVDGIGSEADVMAVGYGAANVIAHWEAYSYTVVYDFENGTKRCEAVSSIIEPVAPLEVYPRINVPHTIWWFNKETTHLSYKRGFARPITGGALKVKRGLCATENRL